MIGDCQSLNDGKGGYECINCPYGLSGQFCQLCNTSLACNFGTLANCCNGTCDTNWSGACSSGTACAAGEVWVPNAAERYCLSAVDPCGSGEAGFSLCPSPAECVNMATVEMNGEYWCYGCPEGTGGSYCELCFSSKACADQGTASNCCGSQCVTGWSGVCPVDGCAKGETWNASAEQCVPDNF